MKKTIGIVLILIAFLLFLSAASNPNIIRDIMPLYAICIIGGIALTIGDLIKWRGKKFQQGINEANKDIYETKYCNECGNQINQNSKFCSHCGKKID